MEIRLSDIPVGSGQVFLGFDLNGMYPVGLWGKNVPAAGRGGHGMGTVLAGRCELEVGTVVTSRGLMVHGV